MIRSIGYGLDNEEFLRYGVLHSIDYYVLFDGTECV